MQDAAPDGLTRLIGHFVELEGRRADGTVFPIELSLAPWGKRGTTGGFACIVRDIASRKALEADRQRSQAFLDTVVGNLPAMLFVKDSQTRKYLLLNRQAATVTGRSVGSMLGKSDGELFGVKGEGYEARDALAATSDKPFVHESIFTKDDGEQVVIRTTRVLLDGPGSPRSVYPGNGQRT